MERKACLSSLFIILLSFTVLLASVFSLTHAAVYAESSEDNALEIIAGEEVVSPRGMFFDAERNRIVFADSDANAVFSLNINTFEIKRIAGGEFGLAEDGLPLGGFVDGRSDKAMFNSPSGVAVLKSGAIIVADTGNHAIRQIYNGNVTTVAGGKQEGDKDGNRWSAEFSYPTSIAVDENDIIYICDSENNKIKKIVNNGDVTTIVEDLASPISIVYANKSLYVTQAGSPIIEGADPDSLRADSILRIPLPKANAVECLAGGSGRGYRNGDAKLAQFFVPSGIFAEGGDLYIADTGNHVVRKIFESGGAKICDTLDLGGFNSPKGIVVADGKLFVADTDYSRIIMAGDVSKRRFERNYEACLVPGSAEIYVDGVELEYTDARPFIINGRTYVPARAFLESIGGDVEWIESERAVLCKYRDLSIKLQEADGIYLKAGRSFIPLRWVAEYFGMEVNWINDTRTVEINTYKK